MNNSSEISNVPSISKQLNAYEFNLLQELKQDLTRHFPGEIVEVLLFGSAARGEMEAESDIDLLVVCRSEDWKRRDEIHDVCFDTNQMLGFRLSVHVLPLSRYQELEQQMLPLALNLEADGVRI
jgi:predicted nucleotidyltransferase